MDLDIRIFEYSEYSHFSKPQIIGQGCSAAVYSTTFKGKKYALKIFKNNSMPDDKTLRRELEFLHATNHPNVIKLYGISTGNDINTLILQFANNGNLRNYLKTKQINGLYRISWNELIKIAKDITRGLKHLHDNDIVHRDLHSMNILINNGSALISCFGISKYFNGTTAGIPAYIEPQCLLHPTTCERDEKSDIYSLGVLLWELTSGIPPFNNIPYEIVRRRFCMNESERESIIENTPLGYYELYKKCWSSSPLQRPTLNEILDQLENLSGETTANFIMNNNVISYQQIVLSRLKRSMIKNLEENRDLLLILRT
ncbi:kinase-like domain-containing protein [Gigaspora rosea]|uniref:Kinase-like domain-containing protein n=1 Tax=Gigaspora rosea TaxID=44941 RepID=A0A397U3H8_9GLOM|nr:kinase-like domain-containing protein [Gigaspora rosea]